MVPGRNLGGWSCPSTAPRIFLCSTGGPCVPGTPLREQHWAGEPPASRHSTATQAAAPSPAPSPHGTWSCNKATEQPSGPRALCLPAHVLRLGACPGAVAAPTHLLLNQVLYAVVHLQVLQGTGGTVSEGQLGRQAPAGQQGTGQHCSTFSRTGEGFPEGNETQPYKGGPGDLCRTGEPGSPPVPSL